MTRLTWVTVALISIFAHTIALGQEEVGPKVYKTVSPSVAFLKSLEGFGTGFVLEETGLILTNAHVITSPLPYQMRVDVKHADGKIGPMIFKKVKIEAIHPKLDLALVSVDAKAANVKLIPVTVSSEKPIPGQRVFAIGNPGGGDGRALEKTFTSGEMSNTQIIEGVPYLQHSAPINPGNSGGPLCNSKGEVIGVNTLKSSREGIGFAIGLEKFNRSVFVAPKDRPRDEKKMKEVTAEIERLKVELGKRRMLGPDHPEVRYGNYLLMQLYSYALAGDPGNKSLYVEIGSLRYSFGHFPVAAAYLSRGIELDPWYKQEAYMHFGQSLSQMGKKEMARLAFAEGIAKFPKESDQVAAALATQFDEGKQWTDAAYYAKLAIAIGVVPNQEDKLNEIYERAIKQLTDSDATALKDRCAKADADYAEMKAAAKDAKAKNQSFLNSEFEKFVHNFDAMEDKAEEVARNLWGDEAAQDPDTTTATPGTTPTTPAPANPAEAAKEIQAGIASAQAQFRAKEQAKAVESLKALIARHPNHTDIKRAKDLLALWDKPSPGTTTKPPATTTTTPIKPPAGDAEAKAIGRKMDLAKLLKKSKQDETAIAKLQEIIDEYPNHPDTQQARDLLRQWKK